MLNYIIQGLTLGLSASAIPGPFQAYLLSQTMRNGWKRTFPATFAPLVSDGPIIILVLVVLSQMPTWFLQVLQLIGGGFLLYLAWGAYQAYRIGNVAEELPTESTIQSFAKAVVVNILNPGPYIFWSTVTGPLFLEGWRQSPSLGVSFVVTFYIGFIGFLIALVTLFTLARSSGGRVSRMLVGISAVALSLFGLYQIIFAVIALISG
jgi:threonine/homoserine/homoserine lactone efflux protein